MSQIESKFIKNAAVTAAKIAADAVDATKIANGSVTEAKLDSGVDAQTFAATHTATNYTPSQVGSEGPTKISAHLKGIDTALGAIDAANKTLSNLTAPTAINQDLVFDKATPILKSKDDALGSENLKIATGDVGSGITSGSLELKTADASGAGSSGSITIKSGLGANGSSGGFDVGSGNSADGVTGDVSIRSGEVQTPGSTDASGSLSIGSGNGQDGTSGITSLFTGDSNGTGPSGDMYLFTGFTSDGNSGMLDIQSGDAAGAGNSGDVNVRAGAVSTGVRGKVKLDGSEIDVSSKKITNLAAGTAAGDAVNKTQLDGKVSKSGDTMSGNLAMGGFKVTGLAAPTANGDALRYDQLGANNGIATLDAGGKVPVSQLPNSVMEFQGQWNASTNSPTLADGVGSAGDVYRVDTAGTQDLGSGSQTFGVGDWVMYSGTVWQKANNSNLVTSVNGQQGVVVLDTDDIAEGTALYFTNERAQDAVGGALVDSASIDFTYNDGANTITADVIPGGVDHDALLNFVANEHVNHASVSITTAVNSGLSGGGDITTTRNLVADPSNAPTVAVASGDLLLFADVSNANALAKATAGSIAALAAPSYAKETFTLAAGDITNQYITLANTPKANSVMLIVKGGAPTLEGAAHDFTMTGAQLNFQNDLATGGPAALVAGDILQVMYAY